VRRVSSATTQWAACKTSTARRVMSPKLPMGVETMYRMPGVVMRHQAGRGGTGGSTSPIDFKIIPQLLLQERTKLAGDARLQLSHSLSRDAKLVS
jgi:hypothetical protein